MSVQVTFAENMGLFPRRKETGRVRHGRSHFAPLGGLDRGFLSPRWTWPQAPAPGALRGPYGPSVCWDRSVPEPDSRRDDPPPLPTASGVTEPGADDFCGGADVVTGAGLALDAGHDAGYHSGPRPDLGRESRLRVRSQEALDEERKPLACREEGPSCFGPARNRPERRGNHDQGTGSTSAENLSKEEGSGAARRSRLRLWQGGPELEKIAAPQTRWSGVGIRGGRKRGKPHNASTGAWPGTALSAPPSLPLRICAGYDESVRSCRRSWSGCREIPPIRVTTEDKCQSARVIDQFSAEISVRIVHP